MFDHAYFNLGVMDSLSDKDTWIHRLDPRTKVICTLAFIVTVVSFPKYAVSGLFPFFLFPVVVSALAEISPVFLIQRVLVVSSFVVFIGLFNPLLEPQEYVRVCGLPLSGGWVSFVSMILKSVLTLSAALLLIATTSFPGVCRALRKIGVPEMFVSQLLFLYRYLFVLLEETMQMVRAREMRAFGSKGFEMRTAIHMIRTLFVRSMERAERVYRAMLARGYHGTLHPLKPDRLTLSDAASVLLVAGALGVFRTMDVVSLLGRQAGRIFP